MDREDLLLQFETRRHFFRRCGVGLGKERFETGSEPYKIIYDWIAQGVPFGDPKKDAVRGLDVEPKEIFLKAPGEGSAVKVTARTARSQCSVAGQLWVTRRLARAGSAASS